ncbi:MAG: Gfo/Idh/MocA family protein [Opitutales bacterium]
MKTRIGILGTGFMAGQHAQRLSALGEAEVTAVGGRTEESARAFCERQELTTAHAFGDYRALIESGLVDAVYFCLPPFAHAGEVELAAGRGLHVFLEKPIALNSAAASRMVAAIEAAGVISQVGFMMRFSQAVRTLKQRIDSGEAGRPSLFTGRFWINMDGSEWWRDRERSGGQIYEQTIHLYDLARYLCGEVSEAFGRIANLQHEGVAGYTVEDTSVGLVRFESGALASITGSNCSVPMHFFADFRIACEKLTLEYRCYGQPWVKPDEATFYPVEGEAETVSQTADCFGEEDRHFIECIQANQPTLCPARDGLAAIELVEQVLRSQP